MLYIGCLGVTKISCFFSGKTDNKLAVFVPRGLKSKHLLPDTKYFLICVYIILTLINYCKYIVKHRWELPVLHYHKIMVIHPYPFLVVITQLLS